MIKLFIECLIYPISTTQLSEKKESAELVQFVMCAY